MSENLIFTRWLQENSCLKGVYDFFPLVSASDKLLSFICRNSLKLIFCLVFLSSIFAKPLVFFGETNIIPALSFDQFRTLYWAGNYREAIKTYEWLSTSDIPPAPDYVILEVAKCYRIIGDYGKAVSLYKSYLEVNSDDKNAIEGLIYTYLDAGQADAALRFVKEQSENNKEKAEWLQLYLADIFIRENKTKEAEAIYSKAFIDDLGNTHAQLGISRILALRNKHAEAEFIIDQALIKEPDNIEALFCKGELLEFRREFMAAYETYEKILKIYPTSKMALNLKYRALINLGCNSLVKDKLEQSRDLIDPDVVRNLQGNEAMNRIQWGEAELALQVLDRNLDYISGDIQKRKPYTGNFIKFMRRTRFDKILALAQKQDMNAVLKEYENLRDVNMELELSLLESQARHTKAEQELRSGTPHWVVASATDAYLYFQEPEKALASYEDVLSQGWDPDYGGSRMSIFHSLIELGRYKEAGRILEQLDKGMPAQIIDRGILRDNWRKEEIAYSRGWLLLYQDRLAEAQRLLKDVLSRAPFNTNARTALAHAYLWRGWPRLAQEEFEIIRAIESKDVAGEIGYCYCLNQNDRGKEARSLAEGLLKKYPNNKHIQRLNRDFEVEDMRTLTLDFGLTREHPGVDDLDWSAKIEQPVAPWRKIFAGYVWRNISQEGLKDKFRREMAGLDWRLNRDWRYIFSVSADENGRKFGYSGQITLDLNDYLSFSGVYDSFSLSVPSRARVFGIDARDWGFSARYRQSENFTSEAAASFLNMSDSNEHRSYNLRLDKALTTGAYWKTRLALEGYALTNSLTDVPYFSPRYLYSVYLVPMVEHTWYRRYEKSLVDRLYLGPGKQWQRGFPRQDVWYIRYEQDYNLSDTLAFLIGTTYSRQNYDGIDTDAQNYYLTLKKHF